MDKIKNVARRLGLITVEDMDQYTALELIMMIANKMNDHSNKIEYLLNNGVLSEIEQIFNEWLQDGTFDSLINQSALKTVNDRIDETNAHLSKILQTKSTQLIIQKMINKEPVNIVCYGDSVTFGFIPFDGNKTANPYPESLQKLLRNYYGYNEINVFNEGFSGRQSDELASDEYVNNVIRHNPNLVIVMMGLNDKLGNFGDVSDIEFYINNLKILREKLNEYELLFLTPTPNYSGNGASDAQITDAKQKITCDIYRNAMINFCNNNKIEFFDLNPVMDNYVKYNVASRITMQTDMLHYSNEYYIKMAECIYIHKLYPLNTIITNDTKYDCMHGIFKTNRYEYFKEAITNPYTYNLVINTDNPVTCELFINVPSKTIYISTLKNYDGAVMKVLVDGVEKKEIECVHDGVVDAKLSTFIEDVKIAELAYGYHKIEIIVVEHRGKKLGYVESLTFKDCNKPFIETGVLESEDKSTNTDILTFRKIGCFENMKQTRLYVSSTSRGGLGIGQTYFNGQKIPLVLIHRNGNEIGLWEFECHDHISWFKTNGINIESSHPTAADFKVDIINYEQKVSIYINNVLLAEISNIERVGDKSIFIANLKVSSDEEFIRTSVTGAKQYSVEVGDSVDDGESYYSYETEKYKHFFNGKWI